MNQSEKRKIILVDDNFICRQALKLLLNETSDFFVLTEISTYKELKVHKALSAANLIFLNYTLSYEMIVAVTEYLKDNYPEIPSILFNTQKADQVVLQCLMNGVKGIVWKTDSIGELLLVCNKVLNGERYLGKKEAEINSHENNMKKHLELLDLLSEREVTVLQLFAHGHSYKKIGEELDISPRTVESHKNNILAKLGLGSLKELISYAIKNNIF